MDHPAWKQSDAFPIIARIIEKAHHEHQRFIPAQEISSLLLLDSECRTLIEMAREQQEEKHTSEWLASNMVAWFSQPVQNFLRVPKLGWASQTG